MKVGLLCFFFMIGFLGSLSGKDKVVKIPRYFNSLFESYAPATYQGICSYWVGLYDRDLAELDFVVSELIECCGRKPNPTTVAAFLSSLMHVFVENNVVAEKQKIHSIEYYEQLTKSTCEYFLSNNFMHFEGEQNKEKKLKKRHWFLIGLGVVVLGAGAYAAAKYYRGITKRVKKLETAGAAQTEQLDAQAEILRQILIKLEEDDEAFAKIEKRLKEIEKLAGVAVGGDDKKKRTPLMNIFMSPEEREKRKNGKSGGGWAQSLLIAAGITVVSVVVGPIAGPALKAALPAAKIAGPALKGAFWAAKVAATGNPLPV
jgi:hypothetical protein